MSFPRYEVVWDTLRREKSGSIVAVDAVIDYGTHRMRVVVEDYIAGGDEEKARRNIVATLEEFVRCCGPYIPSSIVEKPFAFADRKIEIVPGFMLYTGIEFSTTTGYDSWARIEPAIDIDALKQLCVKAAGLVLKEVEASAVITWFDGVQVKWIWDDTKYGEDIEVRWRSERGVVRIPKLDIVRRAVEAVASGVAKQYRSALQRLASELDELEKRYKETADEDDIVVQSIKRQRQSLEMLLDLDND